MKPGSARAKKVQPRFRIVCGKDIAMGPGKAELLEQLQKTGSIADAATEMDMSYMRAWKLIKTMERCFKQPLVKVTRGGAKGGGAELTETGKQVLMLYRQMEAKSLQASKNSWERMLKLLPN
ncbi:MAG: molybdenum-binding transcriptional regulator [Pedosphaera sp.]|nr:molybdenum-binding transcriptional regulator [Pedosphaera sp.]